MSPALELRGFGLEENLKETWSKGDAKPLSFLPVVRWASKPIVRRTSPLLVSPSPCCAGCACARVNASARAPVCECVSVCVFECVCVRARPPCLCPLPGRRNAGFMGRSPRIPHPARPAGSGGSGRSRLSDSLGCGCWAMAKGSEVTSETRVRLWKPPGATLPGLYLRAESPPTTVFSSRGTR